jgi:toxin ParE1/3/4
MSRGILSDRAQSDLAEIWSYTASRWGSNQAERYIREIWRAIEITADNPSRGRACDDIRAGHFKTLVGSHVIIYRPMGDGIGVVRILHQQMDFRRHL